MIVVDSSLALQWILPEANVAVAVKLLGRPDLMAPDILIIEVANVLAKKVRARDMTEAQAQAGLQVVRDAVLQLSSSVTLATAALRLSVEISHPVYDCCFLACAIANDAQLATRDRALIERMSKTGHAAHLWLDSEVEP